MDPRVEAVGFIGAFLAGVLVGLSPCVYPLIPVTVSFIGVKSGLKRSRAFVLSAFYVLGLAVTYSVLGLIAVSTGMLFGQVSSHPASFFLLGNACIIAGLSFLGVIRINFFQAQLQGKISNTGSYLSAFVFGLISGLVISPCTVPVLATILLYVATKQNMVYGISLLFAFACGLGFLLVAYATFGSMVLRLFSSQRHMDMIRKSGGFILIGMGEYFLINAGRLMW